MANMSYCRFRNTLGDLRDCADNLDDDDAKLDPDLDAGDEENDEARARLSLIRLCVRIAEEYGHEVKNADDEDDES